MTVLCDASLLEDGEPSAARSPKYLTWLGVLDAWGVLCADFGATGEEVGADVTRARSGTDTGGPRTHRVFQGAIQGVM